MLLLHRHLPAADVIAGITVALAVGATSADVVAVEARKAGDAGQGRPAATLTPTPSAATAAEPAERMVSLTRRRLAELPADTRPLPSVAAYDQLLSRRPAAGAIPTSPPRQGAL